MCSARGSPGAARALVVGFRTRVRGGKVVRNLERPVVKVVEEGGGVRVGNGGCGDIGKDEGGVKSEGIPEKEGFSHASVVNKGLRKEVQWPVEARVRFEGEGRRVRIAREARLADVFGVVCRSVEVRERDVVLKYVDEEGDLVSVESEEDWNEMWLLVRLFGLLPLEMRLCKKDNAKWVVKAGG